MKSNLIPLSVPVYRIIITVLIFCSVIGNNANAQRIEDVVYLSGGSIIRGTLLPDSAENSVKIINHAGDLWVFNHSEVDSVKRERTFEYKAMQFNQPGFEFGLNGSLLIRSRSTAIGNAAIPGLNFLFGYRFNPYLTAGTEIGMDFYEQMQVPLDAALRLRSSNQSLSPVFFIRAGYTLPAEKRPNDWDYSYKSLGGINSTIGAGIERIINSNTSFMLTFAYHYQELNYNLTPLHQWVQKRDRTETFSRLRLTLGYVFK